MASIRKEIEIERGKEFVWDAIRDVAPYISVWYLGS